LGGLLLLLMLLLLLLSRGHFVTTGAYHLENLACTPRRTYACAPFHMKGLRVILFILIRAATATFVVDTNLYLSHLVT
jgi:hypothetical protein